MTELQTATPEQDTRTDHPAVVAIPTDLRRPVVEDALVEEVSIDGMCGVY